MTAFKLNRIASYYKQIDLGQFLFERSYERIICFLGIKIKLLLKNS